MTIEVLPFHVVINHRLVVGKANFSAAVIGFKKYRELMGNKFCNPEVAEELFQLALSDYKADPELYELRIRQATLPVTHAIGKVVQRPTNEEDPCHEQPPHIQSSTRRATASGSDRRFK